MVPGTTVNRASDFTADTNAGFMPTLIALFGFAPPLLNLDDLPAAVGPTRHADVVRPLPVPTGAAGDQIQGLNEVVPAPVALAMAGNSLLW